MANKIAIEISASERVMLTVDEDAVWVELTVYSGQHGDVMRVCMNHSQATEMSAYLMAKLSTTGVGS